MEARGSRYASDIQMASTVFFCPKPCAPDTASPYRRPIILPAQNCSKHTSSASALMASIKGTAEGGSASIKLTARPTTTISATDHR